MVRYSVKCAFIVPKNRCQVSNAAAAVLIADNLGRLVHPGDGRSPAMVVPLIGYRTTAMPDEYAEQMRGSAKLVGEAIVHTIESGGYSIVSTAELAELRKQAKSGVDRHRHIGLTCTHCRNPIVKRINIDVENPTVNGPHFIEQMHSLHAACPHHPR